LHKTRKEYHGLSLAPSVNEEGAMLGSTGSIEVVCDAPPYEVVRACAALGFRAPLDVRWTRIGHLLTPRARRPTRFGFRWWLHLLRSRSPVRTCTCGHALPDLRRCRFLYPREGESEYLLGQCPRCHSIYWDEP
jgi:hypothetical protein